MFMSSCVKSKWHIYIYIYEKQHLCTGDATFGFLFLCETTFVIISKPLDSTFARKLSHVNWYHTFLQYESFTSSCGAQDGASSLPVACPCVGTRRTERHGLNGCFHVHGVPIVAVHAEQHCRGGKAEDLGVAVCCQGSHTHPPTPTAGVSEPSGQHNLNMATSIPNSTHLERCWVECVCEGESERVSEW